jgi:hypothetical protein
MHYSDSKAVVSKASDTPTREFSNGLTVVTPRPSTRAADLHQVSWITAFSRDPYAFVILTFAPLAGRNPTAPPIPAFVGST